MSYSEEMKAKQKRHELHKRVRKSPRHTKAMEKALVSSERIINTGREEIPPPAAEYRCLTDQTLRGFRSVTLDDKTEVQVADGQYWTNDPVVAKELGDKHGFSVEKSEAMARRGRSFSVPALPWKDYPND